MAVSSVNKNELGEHMRRVGIDVVSITRDPMSEMMHVRLNVKVMANKFKDELDAFQYIALLGLSIQYRVPVEEYLDNVKGGGRE